MNTIILTGSIAGLLTTVAFLPQVVRTWRTRTTEGLSLSTFIIQFFAVVLWVVYGFSIKELPLILWNAVTAALVFIIIYFILKYSRQKTNIAAAIFIAVVVIFVFAMIFNMEIIGYVASALGTVAFLPQAIRAWKAKETKDISLGMYVVFWFGVALWLAYGILIKNPPVIFVNTVVLSSASTILFLKIRYG